MELEPIRCENDFFGSSMDLGLEPSAIFLSTQTSIDKKLQIQNTGDLPVLRNLQSLPLLNRWPIDLNSFGAKRINWRRSNVMEVGDKNISKSPSILVFLKNAYHIRWFGMLMFFFVVMFGEFCFQNFGDFTPGVFGQSFLDSEKHTHADLSHGFPRAQDVVLFILFKVLIPHDTVRVYGCFQK